MRLTKNFTFEEFVRSTTARRKGIDNAPKGEAVDNLMQLAKTILQPIRDAWGGPIVISSGYRCGKLNRAVKGAKNSDHLYGAAADIHTLSDERKDNKALFDLIVLLANKGQIECRQIIDEYGYNWVHVSINHRKNQHKNNQVLHVR